MCTLTVRLQWKNEKMTLIIERLPDDDVTLFILGKYKYKMIQVEVKNNK